MVRQSSETSSIPENDSVASGLNLKKDFTTGKNKRKKIIKDQSIDLNEIHVTFFLNNLKNLIYFR